MSLKSYPSVIALIRPMLPCSNAYPLDRFSIYKQYQPLTSEKIVLLGKGPDPRLFFGRMCGSTFNQKVESGPVEQLVGGDGAMCRGN